MNNEIEKNWENATWKGSRRAMIKQSLQLTVRERLLALEELNILSQKLLSIKTSTNNSTAMD